MLLTKRIVFFVVILLLMLVLLTKNIFSSDVGKIWQSEKKTWIDSEFGYEITQWTNHSKKSWHLYFNIECFIDNNHAMIFSERSGKLNLFQLNLSTGEMIQMTDEKDMHTHVWHLPQLKTLWYISGKSIKTLNTETFQSSVVKKMETTPRSFTVTCDGKWIVFARDDGAAKFKKGIRKGLGPFAIYKMDARTGNDLIQISPGYGFVIGHLQANPTDPNIISYCWQHLYKKGDYPGTKGSTPIRIWWLNINGTDGGPVVPQEFGIHRTHEFWFPDGSRMGYSARYQFGPNNKKQFLGSSKIDGNESFMMPAPIGPAHSQIFKDNRHWVVDIYDGMVLTLFTIENKKIIETNKLFRHDSSWKGQASHPHPHFSPDGKLVIFSTDKTGTANVYTVRINLEKN